MISGDSGASTLSVQRFALDSTLGKLARHLRMLGFDTLLLREEEAHRLALISSEENRIVLTTDPAIFDSVKNARLKHRVTQTDPGAQLREVIREFELEEPVLSGLGFLTRCLDCNSHLLPVKGHHVVDRIPGELLLQHDEFLLCSRCERIFWQGPQWERLQRWARELLSG